jgi:LmbE family N-acetylglucosaminyl deacetylase
VNSRKNKLSLIKRKKDLELLRQDCVSALFHLGVHEDRIYLGEFPDNEMDKHSLLEVIHWFERIVDTVQPDIVFTHHRFCTNIDHQYCHNAAVVALRPAIDKKIPLFCGEVPSSTGYLRPTYWEPNLYVSVSEEDVNNKIIAMESYTGEARPDPHPRSREVLKALAKVRGSESGNLFAESFMIQKTYG